MSYPCDKLTYFYDNVYTPGFGLLNHSFYPTNDAIIPALDGYYSDGSYVYTVSAGVVIAVVTVGDCGSTPPPPPITWYEIPVAGKNNSSGACTDASVPSLVFTRYSANSISDFENIASMIDPATELLTFELYLWTDDALTSPVSNFYYSNGTYWWRVTGGAGRVTDAGLC